MPQRIPWARVLVEGVVIVGSILLAFGIDATWDERQERERTDRQFQALIREFHQTRAELEREVEGVEDARVGTAGVLELMRARDPAPDPEELASRVLQSMDVGIFTAQHPVMTMLMTSGDLVDLDNQELLGLFANWRARMEHLRIDAQHLENNREDMIFNRLVEIGVTLDFDRPTSELLPMLRDPGLEVAFALRQQRANMLADSYGLAIDRLDHIVSVLEEVLVRGGRQ